MITEQVPVSVKVGNIENSNGLNYVFYTGSVKPGGKVFLSIPAGFKAEEITVNDQPIPVFPGQEVEITNNIDDSGLFKIFSTEPLVPGKTFDDIGRQTLSMRFVSISEKTARLGWSVAIGAAVVVPWSSIIRVSVPRPNQGIWNKGKES